VARRDRETVEFADPDGIERVVPFMDRLSAAHDGWINLMPGVPEHDGGRPPVRTGISAIFGTALPDVTMCTWFPAPAQGRGVDEETLGILHPTGRFAARRLAGLEAPVPEGWRVTQDNARRGLLLKIPAGTPHQAIAEWAVLAGTVLCLEEMTGMWRAVVYFPVSSTRAAG
jgi:hypothetical protein